MYEQWIPLNVGPLEPDLFPRLKRLPIETKINNTVILFQKKRI